ncbi:MAG: phage holin [Oscillospiraceae bacterium]|nr:phage holin [Oscillospiraceae bacterium]MBR3610618.1 phage holin [Oscillospiraceae bacterium]
MNIFKNINWKVRFRNPIFWSTIIPAVTGFVYTVLGAFGTVPAVAEDTVLNMIFMLISMLTTLGVLVDPTTSGVADSRLAMTYEKPRKDDLGEEVFEE